MHVDQYSVRFILFICRKEGKEGNIVDFENKRGRKRKRDARGREGGGVGISLMITQCPQKRATSDTMATTLFTRQSREVICLEDKWSLFFSNFLSLTSLVSFSSLPLLGNLYLPFLSKTSPLLTHTHWESFRFVLFNMEIRFCFQNRFQNGHRFNHRVRSQDGSPPPITWCHWPWREPSANRCKALSSNIPDLWIWVPIFGCSGLTTVKGAKMAPGGVAMTWAKMAANAACLACCGGPLVLMGKTQTVKTRLVSPETGPEWLLQSQRQMVKLLRRKRGEKNKKVRGMNARDKLRMLPASVIHMMVGWHTLMKTGPSSSKPLEHKLSSI